MSSLRQLNPIPEGNVTAAFDLMQNKHPNVSTAQKATDTTTEPVEQMI